MDNIFLKLDFVLFFCAEQEEEGGDVSDDDLPGDAGDDDDDPVRKKIPRKISSHTISANRD